MLATDRRRHGPAGAEAGLRLVEHARCRHRGSARAPEAGGGRAHRQRAAHRRGVDPVVLGRHLVHVAIARIGCPPRGDRTKAGQPNRPKTSSLMRHWNTCAPRSAMQFCFTTFKGTRTARSARLCGFRRKRLENAFRAPSSDCVVFSPPPAAQRFPLPPQRSFCPPTPRRLPQLSLQPPPPPPGAMGDAPNETSRVPSSVHAAAARRTVTTGTIIVLHTNVSRLCLTNRVLPEIVRRGGKLAAAPDDSTGFRLAQSSRAAESPSIIAPHD